MLTISVSLVAVFIPILAMGGIVGRLLREFAMALSIAIVISMLAVADGDADDVRVRAAARGEPDARAGSRASSERSVRPRCSRATARSLTWALRHCAS